MSRLCTWRESFLILLLFQDSDIVKLHKAVKDKIEVNTSTYNCIHLKFILMRTELVQKYFYHPSVNLPFHSSIHPSIRPSLHPPTHPPTHSSIQPTIPLSVCPSIHPLFGVVHSVLCSVVHCKISFKNTVHRI